MLNRSALACTLTRTVVHAIAHEPRFCNCKALYGGSIPPAASDVSQVRSRADPTRRCPPTAPESVGTKPKVRTNVPCGEEPMGADSAR